MNHDIEKGKTAAITSYILIIGVFIAMSMWISLSVLWTYGIFSAINGETKPIPLLGNYFQKWLGNIS